MKWFFDSRDKVREGFRGRAHFCLFAAGACVVGGCKTQPYQYRVTEDDQKAKVVAERPITVQYGPLEYYFMRTSERLDMRIINHTGQRIVLLGSRSSVIDPEGARHPLHDRVLAPESYTGMELPPEPRVYPSYGAWQGGLTGTYEPLSGPVDGVPYYWPSETYFGLKSPFEWEWKSGTARLQLVYQAGGRSFEHDFLLVRDRER
jgi:hypothetical protein